MLRPSTILRITYSEKRLWVVIETSLKLVWSAPD